MNIRPRHHTFENQTKSLHYVNSYALKGRVDFSSFQQVSHDPLLHPIPLHDAILPSDSDHDVLMTILAGRILAESIPELAKLPGLATHHIEHLYSKEMSSKSEVVNVRTCTMYTSTSISL